MSKENLRSVVENVFDDIERGIGEIIEHCNSGNYSMNEIADELKELCDKVY